MKNKPEKPKSIPTYESQQFSGLIVADPDTSKNKIRINDEADYSYFLQKVCRRGDVISVYITNKRPKLTELQRRYFYKYLSLISLSSGHSLPELKIWVKGKFLSQGITEVFGFKVRKVKNIEQLNISEMANLLECVQEATGIPLPKTDLFKKINDEEEKKEFKNKQARHYRSLKAKKLKI